MGITTKQIKFNLKNLGATTAANYSVGALKSNTSDTGDIVFVYNNSAITSADAVRKIYARGQEWDGTNTHYVNTFTIKGGTTTVTTFDQQTNQEFSVLGSSGISVTGDANKGTITIEHSTADGYKHIPSGGASNKYLTYSGAGTAAWSTATIGAANSPVYIKDGVITQIGFTIDKNVPSGAMFTDTTYGLSANDSKQVVLTPTVNGTDGVADQSATRVTFAAGTGLSVTGNATTGITYSIDSTYQIPTTTEVSNWNSAYDWYKNTVVTTSDTTDTKINKWQEVVNFLDDYDESDSLKTLLDDKADKGHVHDVVSTSANGFAPQIFTSTTAVTEDDYILVSISGAEPTWKKIPATAFATYSSNWILKTPTTASPSTATQVGRAYTPSQALTVTIQGGTDTTSVKVVGSGATTDSAATVTVTGPSLITASGTAGTTNSYDAATEAQTMFWFDM